MKKLKEKLDSVLFTHLITGESLRQCSFCYHHNGECVDLAMRGKCKAYDYLMTH